MDKILTANQQTSTSFVVDRILMTNQQMPPHFDMPSLDGDLQFWQSDKLAKSMLTLSIYHSPITNYHVSCSITPGQMGSCRDIFLS